MDLHPSAARAPRLVLVGGGHAMLPSILAARGWVEAGASVQLVNDHRYLYYSGMVPEYLGGVYTRDEVRVDLEGLCARVGIPFVEARAVRLEPAAHTLVTDAGARLDYDLIAFDIGACNPAPMDGAIATKPLHGIDGLAQRLDAALAQEAEAFRLVVVGGGAAGVEMALNVANRFAGRWRSQQLVMHLIETAGRLLPGFPPRMGTYAAKLLRRRGVTIRLNTRATEVAEGRVALEGHAPLQADAVLCATGTVGPPLFREARLPCDAQGFLRVNATLQSVADPRVFAAGDCAAVTGYEDLAKIGVHAVKQGPVLRDNLTRALDDAAAGTHVDAADLKPFKPYRMAPLILSTGTPEALWVAGRWWFHGSLFLRLKHYVDRRWMRRYHETWNDAGLARLLDARSAIDARTR